MRTAEPAAEPGAAAAEPPAAVTGGIPPLIKRNTLLLAASQAIVGTGTQMVPTLSALMIEAFLRSATFAGLGYSALGVSRFLIAYPLGRLSDRYGRKAGLRAGLAASFVGAIGLGAAQVLQSFPLFCVALIVFGMGVGGTQQLRLAAADMFPPARRAEGLGYVLTGSLVGAVGGPLLIGLAQGVAPAAGLDTIAVAWLLVPALVLPSLVLVSLVRPDPRDIALRRHEYYPGDGLRVTGDGGRRPGDGSPVTGVGGRTHPTPSPATGDPSPIVVAGLAQTIAYANSTAAQATMAMLMALTPISLAHHGHSLQEISVAVAMHVVGMFAFSLPLGRLSDVIGRRPVLLAGAVVSAVGAVLVPLGGGFWLPSLGIFLVGLGWSCSYVAATAVIADVAPPERRGRAIGVNDTLAGVAAIAAPAAGGVLVQFFGLPSLGLAGVACLLVPFAMTFALPETAPKLRVTTVGCQRIR